MVNSISDVVRYQLCTGCGVCAYLEPDRFQMLDTLDFGKRPFIKINATEESGEGFTACPGISLSHTIESLKDSPFADLTKAWGPVYGVWEGYASNEEIRFAGSSGGAATALALFSLEQKGMAGVLHTAAKSDQPYLNETVLSKTYDELLSRTGSRYSPASPTEQLDLIVQASSECVFIGKPCDVAAAQKARKIRPELDNKLGLTIAFFCAGVPSLRGNLNLAQKQGAQVPDAIKELRYRGLGWPGHWKLRYEDENKEIKEAKLTYSDSWGYLQKYRQWRCYICPDHTGEFADIAVGDPWYRTVKGNDPGRSLIVARTEKGLATILEAAEAGYITLVKSSPEILPQSQKNLLSTRRSLWGRLVALRLLGVTSPYFSGFSLFGLWFNELSFSQKIRSITSTFKRVFVKKLNTPVEPKPFDY